jgi:hypothetical protein
MAVHRQCPEIEEGWDDMEDDRVVKGKETGWGNGMDEVRWG